MHCHIFLVFCTETKILLQLLYWFHFEKEASSFHSDRVYLARVVAAVVLLTGLSMFCWFNTNPSCLAFPSQLTLVVLFIQLLDITFDSPSISLCSLIYNTENVALGLDIS